MAPVRTLGGLQVRVPFEQAWPSCALPPVPNWKKNDNNNNGIIFSVSVAI